MSYSKETRGNPAGTKLANKAAKGSVGLKHGRGGIVAQSIREMSKDKFLADKANA